MKHKLLLVLLCAAAALLIAGAALLLYINGLDKALDSSKSDTVNITIETGSTTDSIGALLQEKGIIESASDFKFFSRFKGFDGRYQAGTYAFAPSMKLSEIAEIMVSGKDEQHDLYHTGGVYDLPNGGQAGRRRDRRQNGI